MGLFVAPVVGNSMNRIVPNGAWCVFRSNPPDPEGKVVLAWRAGDAELENGGQLLLKRFRGEYKEDAQGERVRVAATLEPESTEDSYEAIVLGDDGNGVRVIAELVEVLG